MFVLKNGKRVEELCSFGVVDEKNKGKVNDTFFKCFGPTTVSRLLD